MIIFELSSCSKAFCLRFSFHVLVYWFVNLVLEGLCFYTVLFYFKNKFGITVYAYYLHFMEAEKRKPRAYKISDKPYFAAMKRCKKEDIMLAQLIERVVIAYACGYHIKITSEK